MQAGAALARPHALRILPPKDLQAHDGQGTRRAEPEVGQFVQVRHRRWLVDAVEPANAPGDSALATFSCIDDDAVGATLTVLWDAEPDAAVMPGSGWQKVGAAEFDPPDRFGAFYRTMRWG